MEKITHNFHQSIIRAYDIRGIYNQTLFDKDAFFIGKAFGSFLDKNSQKKIAVACDARLSSPALKAELIKALLESGLEVIDVGVGPTPMLYFAVQHLDCDAGIMVTGSHNPKDHNGFKITLKDRPFFGEDILNLAKMALDGDFVKKEGVFDSKNVLERYVERILSDCVIANSQSGLLDELDDFAPRKELKIAWDCGNGAAGEVAKALSKRIAAKHFVLFSELDGNFPNHHPDPSEEKNLEDLKKVVLEEGCDLGIAFDGDGDRIGVIDDKGQILWPDELMVFYARQILQENKGATIISDVKASNVLFDEIKKSGGNALMWKTGHSFIKSKMKETGALLAGEMSGHIFFADGYYGFDDALYAAIRIINIVEKSSSSLSSLKNSLPKTFSTPEIRVDCADDKKFETIKKLSDYLKESKVEFNDIDGVRAMSDKGWWLIRASNTQPILVARCEGYSSENLEELKKDLIKNLEFCQVEIPKELT